MYYYLSYSTLFFQIVIENTKYIPISQINYSDDYIDIILENIILTTDHILPDLMEVKTKNSFFVSRRYPDFSDQTHSFSLNLYEIQAELKNMPFEFRKKKGMIKINERGVCNLLIGGEGITVKIKYGLDFKSADVTLQVLRISTSMDDINFEIVSSTMHSPCVYKFWSGTLQKILKRELTKAITKKIIMISEQVDIELTKLKLQLPPGSIQRLMNLLRNPTPQTEVLNENQSEDNDAAEHENSELKIERGARVENAFQNFTLKDAARAILKKLL